MTTRLEATLDGWYIGNIIFGGLIGFLIVDPLTGAMWKLPEQAMTSLPTGETSISPIVADATPAPSVPAPVPAAAVPTAMAVPASFRNVHVLAIGSGTFADGSITNLPYAEADAKHVYDFFSKSDRSPARADNVHLLTSEPNTDGLKADRVGIATALDRYLIKRAVYPDDLVILFYSGHGDQDESGTYYWVPLDAHRGSLAATAFPETELNRLVSLIPAKNRMIIADACHSGALSGKKAMGIGAVVAGVPKAIGETDIRLASCTKNEVSAEWKEKGHGVFCWALVEGLSGNADSASGNGDDRVSLGELGKFLQQRVPRYAQKAGGKQSPPIVIPDAYRDLPLTR